MKVCTINYFRPLSQCPSAEGQINEAWSYGMERAFAHIPCDRLPLVSCIRPIDTRCDYNYYNNNKLSNYHTHCQHGGIDIISSIVGRSPSNVEVVGGVCNK